MTTLCETKGSREYKIRCNTYKSRISYQLRLTFNVNLLKLTPTIATLGIGITNYQLPMPTAYRTSTYFLATIGPENNYLVDLKNLKINQTCAGSVVSSVVFNSNNEISNPFNWTWWKINGKEAVVEKFLTWRCRHLRTNRDRAVWASPGRAVGKSFLSVSCDGTFPL